MGHIWIINKKVAPHTQHLKLTIWTEPVRCYSSVTHPPLAVRTSTERLCVPATTPSNNKHADLQRLLSNKTAQHSH